MAAPIIVPRFKPKPSRRASLFAAVRARYDDVSRTIALVVTFRRVIAGASRHTRRSRFCIERLYPIGRSCLNVYAPDTSNVDDSNNWVHLNWPRFRAKL